MVPYDPDPEPPWKRASTPRSEFLRQFKPFLILFLLMALVCAGLLVYFAHWTP